MISEERLKEIFRDLLSENLEAQSDWRSRIPSMVLIYPIDQGYLRTGFGGQQWMLKLCCMAPGEEHTLEGSGEVDEGETHPELGWYLLEDLGKWTGPIIKWAKSHEKILQVVSPRLGAVAEWVHQDPVTSFLSEKTESLSALNLPETQLPPEGGDYLPVSSDLIRLAGLNERDYRVLEGQGLIFLKNIFEQRQPCGNLHLFIHKGRMLWLCKTHLDKMKAARTVSNGRSFLQSPTHQLSADLSDFVGRNTEENQLLTHVRARRREAAICTISGMGGIGKTVLANRVGNKLKSVYQDAQIVIDMYGTSATPLTPVAALTQIIRAFDATTELPTELNLLVKYYRSLLGGKRVLLILDNAKDAAQVRPLQPPNGCGMLVTARARIIIEGGLLIELDSLCSDEAIQLLKKILVKRQASDAILKTIADCCGKLPLAIRAAGTFLAIYQDWSLEEYLTLFLNKKEQLKLLKVQDIDVESSLTLSVSQLSKENQSLAEQWRILTIFPSDFDRAAAAAVWAVNLEVARVNLSELFLRTLVQFDSQNHRYKLHDIMRTVALSLSSEITEGDKDGLLYEAERRHAFYYASIFKSINELYFQGNEHIAKAFALFDSERTNIEVAFNWASNHYLCESGVESE